MIAPNPSDPRDPSLNHLRRVIERHARQTCTPILLRCAPRLLDLLKATHDRPVEEVLPLIRQVVLEHCEACRCFNGTMPDCSCASNIEGQIALISHEMMRIRKAEMRRGQWAEYPVPPEMFG